MNELAILFILLMVAYSVGQVVQMIISVACICFITLFFLCSINGDKNIYYWYKYMRAKKGMI